MDSLMEEIERIFRQSQDENWSYEEECGEKPVLYKGAIFLLNLFSLGFLIFCQVADCYMGFIKEGREMAAYGEKK